MPCSLGDLSLGVPDSFLARGSSEQSPQRHAESPQPSVSVFLPEAVLIKALNSRGSTQEDSWRDVVAVCSLEGTLSQSDTATQLTLSSEGGTVRGCPAYFKSEQVLLKTIEVTRHQCSVSFG